MTKRKDELEALKQTIQDAIEKHGLPLTEIPKGTPTFRVQETEHSNPLFYNPKSDSRYGDPQGTIGVCYVAFSDVVAVAETVQHGKAGEGTPVTQQEIEARSLHELEAARLLKVVDSARLVANTGRRLGAIVQSKGQGSQGYAFTQALSDVVMRHTDHVDGIIYTSQVYPSAGRQNECNLALFADRPEQLKAVRKTPLGELELSTEETVGELLNRLQVPIE
ncbi:RES family NAD+ phosphorylase [Pseudomonas tohonis]|uniref:RES domain-containing protein n=1 Tax=Pseudomonas tohonis TaxID=2725477 RepID=A0ABQ4VZ98_9PSED|nr:RES family NAD+ phosphorylase [Pseudomonas tohonis]GJN52534.1 hypothetical protein TUM20286_22860 [Pseudomonas tohonis]